MTEKILDSQVLVETLNDFASHYGDQDALDIIRGWHLKKLGKSPEKLPIGYVWSHSQGFGDAMALVRKTVNKLKTNSQGKTSEYLLGVYQASIEILKDLNKQGSQLL